MTTRFRIPAAVGAITGVRFQNTGVVQANVPVTFVQRLA